MKFKFLLLFTLILQLQTYAEADECTCAVQDDLHFTKNETKTIYTEKLNLFHSQSTVSFADYNLKVESKNYEGLSPKGTDSFFMYLYNKKGTLINKIDLSKKFKSVFGFHIAKRNENEAIFVVERSNGEGSILNILTIDLKTLTMSNIYSVEGRKPSVGIGTSDHFSYGHIQVNLKNEFVISFQRTQYHPAKFTHYKGGRINFFKFGNDNRIIWKRYLSINKYYERDDNAKEVYIKDKNLYLPKDFNKSSSLMYKDGCYYINNHISNFYGYYAIDENGEFCSSDKNRLNEIEKQLTKKPVDVSLTDWIITILFFGVLYFIFKMVKKVLRKK